MLCQILHATFLSQLGLIWGSINSERLHCKFSFRKIGLSTSLIFFLSCWSQLDVALWTHWRVNLHWNLEWRKCGNIWIGSYYSFLSLVAIFICFWLFICFICFIMFDVLLYYFVFMLLLWLLLFTCVLLLFLIMFYLFFMFFSVFLLFCILRF